MALLPYVASGLVVLLVGLVVFCGAARRAPSECDGEGWGAMLPL